MGGWSNVGRADVSFMGRCTKLFVLKLMFAIPKVYCSFVVFIKYSHETG